MSEDLHCWLELSALQHRYFHALDNGLFETWPDFFTEDGTYTILSKENADRQLPAPLIFCRNRKMMRDRIVALRHANIYGEHTYRHAAGGLVIDARHDDEVRTTCSYIVVSTNEAGDSTVFQAGCYQDIAVKHDGVWRYREKRVLYDTSRVQTLLAIPI